MIDIHDLGIIVLSNDIIKNGNKWLPDKSSEMRVMAANEVYKDYCLDKKMPYVIFSGGCMHSEEPSLAEVLADYSKSRFNLDNRSVGIEKGSLNTVENALYSLHKLRGKNIEDYLIITNEFHLGRTADCFRTVSDIVKWTKPKRIVSAEDILIEKEIYSNDEIDMFKQRSDIKALYKYHERRRKLMNTPLVGYFVSRWGVRVYQSAFGKRPRNAVR